MHLIRAFTILGQERLFLCRCDCGFAVQAIADSQMAALALAGTAHDLVLEREVTS